LLELKKLITRSWSSNTRFEFGDTRRQIEIEREKKKKERERYKQNEWKKKSFILVLKNLTTNQTFMFLKGVFPQT